MLTPGTPAPDLNLVTTGGSVRLADLRGAPLVLFFYPKAGTGGCTIEARGFREAHAAIAAKGVRVLGISKDSLKTQTNWKGKEGFPYDLVADDGTACIAFGAWREKKNYGRSYMGIARITVLIDAKGNIARVWDPVKANGHAEQVLAAL